MCGKRKSSASKRRNRKGKRGGKRQSAKRGGKRS